MAAAMIKDPRQRAEWMAQMASGVAHDLNNQMMLILNHLEFAAAGIPASDSAHESLCEVRRAAERCTEMIRSLANVGRPSIPNRALVNLEKLIEETGRLLEEMMPPEIELILAVEPALPPVLANATELHQVITNLALNAKDAMEGGGQLAIEALHSEGSAVLIVSDTGCGMPTALQAQIFQPYFTTKKKSGGGLGLSMVSSIVHKHGASLSVESIPGGGATFRIQFPCATLE